MAETDKEKLNKLSPVSLGLIIGSAVLIMAFILGILYPQYRRINRIKDDRVNKTIRLEEQKRLFPIYAQAEVLAAGKFEPVLPMPERHPISRNEVVGLSGVFNRIALEAGMVLAENSLDIDTFAQDSNMLSLEVMFKGDIFSFRDCLVALAGLPYFKGIESINISTDRATNIRKCKVKLQISIASNQMTPNQKKKS